MFPNHFTRFSFYSFFRKLSRCGTAICRPYQDFTLFLQLRYICITTLRPAAFLFPLRSELAFLPPIRPLCNYFFPADTVFPHLKVCSKMRSVKPLFPTSADRAAPADKAAPGQILPGRRTHDDETFLYFPYPLDSGRPCGCVLFWGICPITGWERWSASLCRRGRRDSNRTARRSPPPSRD